MNLYAPNEYDSGFFREIANVIADNSKGTLIIGGDFNAVQNGRLDKTPAEKGPQNIKTQTLNNLLSGLGLVDPCTAKKPTCICWPKTVIYVGKT